MSPSLAGLQDLIDVCSAYAEVNDIVFIATSLMLCCVLRGILVCPACLFLGLVVILPSVL